MSAKIIIFGVFTVVFIHLSSCVKEKEVGRKTLKKQNSFPKSTYTPPPGASGHSNTEEKGKTKNENKEEKPKNKGEEDESDLEEGEFNPKYYKYTSKQKLWTG
uniref:Uncharacterized protein n=1 Tax=Meloidogyne enterolobii TaxID=390850 RepID=A0A6V7VBB3_MELEN|nr:unnamed protein product [Meloidogyne enterolobii]